MSGMVAFLTMVAGLMPLACGHAHGQMPIAHTQSQHSSGAKAGPSRESSLWRLGEHNADKGGSFGAQAGGGAQAAGAAQAPGAAPGMDMPEPSSGFWAEDADAANDTDGAEAASAISRPADGPLAKGTEAKARAQPNSAQIASALRRYAGEPDVEAVVRAALQTARNDPEQADAMASRARSSGWLPTLRLGLRRGLARDLSAYQTVEVDKTSQSTDDDLVLEASLAFQLGKLIFHRSEVAIAREGRALADARADLIRTVIHAFFERRRLQLERDLGGRADIGRQIRIAELEALLNAFTDGAFGRMMSAKK